MEELDLIDDLWLQVFSYFGVDRGRLATVCKRWSNLILHPKYWRVFEVDFVRRRFNRPFGSDMVVQASIQPFIAKYCMNLIDCNLGLKRGSDSAFLLLNTLLQIKTLRRLSLRVDAGSFGGGASQSTNGETLVEPQCKDLVLLNLRQIALKPMELQNLLNGLPNLEQLYLSQTLKSIGSMDALAPATKLKRLSCQEEDISGCLSQLQVLSELLPNLQCVFYLGKSGIFAEPVSQILTVGNILISPSMNRSAQRTVERLRQLSSVISPESHPLLLMRALQSKDSVAVIRFLVTELKYDVNYLHQGRFIYSDDYESPFLERKYPLHAAIDIKGASLGGNAEFPRIEVVEELLKLGANPNSPMADESPLSYCQDSATFLLLLKYGANPNKLRNGLPVFWSIFSREFADPVLVLQAVLDTCDINAEFGSSKATALMQAYNSTKREELVRLLLSAGAKWTPEALNGLSLSIPSLFEEVIRNKSADLSMVRTSVVFNSLERGMLPLFQDHLRTLTADSEAPMLSPMHYAALSLVAVTSEQSYNSLQAPKREKSIQRWPLFTSFGLKESEKPRRRLVGVEANNNLGATTGPGSPDLDAGPKSGFGSTSGFSKPTLFATSTTTTTTTSPSSFGTTLPSNGFGNTAASTFSFGAQQKSVNPFSPLAVSAKKPQLTSIDEVIQHLNCSINEKTSDGATPLLLLCKSLVHNSEAKVKNATSLIKHGANVNLADVNGWTPLHAALYIGDWKLTALLLEHGANINAQDLKGITPLMSLIYGFRHITQLSFSDFETEWAKFIALDVDLTLVDHSFHRSLAHLMAAVGSPAMFECAKDKLLRPEFINAKDIEGFTPLHYAVMFDNFNTVQYLMANGADVNAQTTALKLTPAMMLCSMISQSGLTTYLMHYNTLLLSQASFCSLQPLFSFLPGYSRRLVEPPWIFSTQEESIAKETWSNFSMLTTLVSNPRLDLIDEDGNTILHHLVEVLTQPAIDASTVRPFMQILLNNTSLKPLWDTKNSKNETPAFLLIARMFGHLARPSFQDVMNLLKDNKINPDQYSAEGKPAIEIVLQGPLPSDVKLEFMNYCGSVTYPESRSSLVKTNPLFSALKSNIYSVSLIQMLVRTYPNAIKETNECGATPLIFYVTTLLQNAQVYWRNALEALSVIDTLLAAPGVDVNAQDENGNTALHVACKYFHTGVIDAIDANLNYEEQVRSSVYCVLAFKLVKANARTDLKNNRGQTALDLSPMLILHYERVYPIVASLKVSHPAQAIFETKPTESTLNYFYKSNATTSNGITA